MDQVLMFILDFKFVDFKGLVVEIGVFCDEDDFLIFCIVKIVFIFMLR